MAHIARSKSFAHLMAKKAKDGVEPLRVEIFIETHKQRKDGRPIDSESAQKIEKLSNNQHNDEEFRDNVAWDGDIYSQEMGVERAGQVRGLGLVG
ncbi:putative ovule protein [Cocos nucifera]|uniref:Putative ovule protein n=1 Tax=Cocos nucifera TaxID=13894 RepID=A0A8K0IUX2_COCNU|nr:putative ovule protein [Cocos nucifera]